MARENWVDLYAPDGTPVSVLDTASKDTPRGRVEVLKERGYTDKKPRNPKGPANTGDSPELAQMRAELEKLRAENEKLKSDPSGDSGTAPEFAPPQTGTSTAKK